MSNPSMHLEVERRGTRWWPLALILILEVVAFVVIWNGPAIQRQQQVMRSGAAILIGVVFVLLWLLFFSRMRWRRRLVGAVGMVGAMAVLASLFRYEGVSGDLVPLFSLKWRAPAGAVVSTAKAQPGKLPENFAGYPQFLGPTRDGLIPGPVLARNWSAQPPELTWRVPVGEGFAGFAIAGPRALTLEQDGANESVVCRDLFTGATQWAHVYAARYENPVGGTGPRTTPTVVGERVLTMGATGLLHCLELTTGRVVWQRDTLADAGAKCPDWGVACSPLVTNDLVIVTPGGREHSLAAYRLENGQSVWSAGDVRAGYSSPQLVTLAGVPQFLVFNHEGVAGHAAADGRALWTYPWPPSAQHVSDPRVVAPNRFVVSSGYGAGVDLVELTRENESWKTSRIWHSIRLKSKFGSLVVHEGFLYGLDDGRLTCIDLANGEAKWKGGRIGHGQVLLAGDVLLVTAENGDVLLMEASPEAVSELGRFSTLSGKMWNPPALAPPFLIVRTEREAACYRLPLR
jgi:outer membrane protein assembly factor BamB